MSLKVHHLNADATFLLVFKPALEFPPSPGSHPGSFSILLDPWLLGDSTVFSPKFSIQRHTGGLSVESLDEIPEPDLVIVSQDKPDHCHERTLRQLRPDRMATTILAEPSAAKRIRSWRFFDPEQVKPMERFDHRNPTTVRRYPIPAFTPTGSPGEVTVSFLTNPRDITGLHNAVGITYRPPRANIINFSHPFTVPRTPPGSSSSTTSLTSPNERTLSVLFSPHGLCYSHIQPYAVHHLVPEAALPLTALFHPFDRIENPWFLGGPISLGLPGGMVISQALYARYWISCHDEEKELGGVTTATLKKKRYSKHEAEAVLEDPKGRKFTGVVFLDVGEDIVVP
ncbi:MAG: hypothetical protein M1814_000882 [Vezdaea aestivalis]|nr:MAG: hypothetical protein M1814_000882 [Vezdaea aestivalis]